MRIAVVTGGNKGIGLSICKQLAKEKGYHVILTARTASLGTTAVEQLKTEFGITNVEFAPLDITNKETISALANFLKTKYNGLDVLVNNAGMAFKGDAFDQHVASETLGTNYFGTLMVCEHLLPLVREGGRVVNVSSSAGMRSKITNKALHDEFASPSLTIPRLSELMNKFIDDVATGTYTQEGWPKTIGVTALTKIFARDEALRKKNVRLSNGFHSIW